MTHFLGRVVADGRTFNQTTGLDLTPGPGPLGGPRFIMLHFNNVALSAGTTLTVNLGYGTDVFTSTAGSDFWSRPVDIAVSPIQMRIVGGTGSAQLLEYGSGEPGIPPGQTPGTSIGSQSNPDPFLATNPYQEPIYETRLECTPGFAWQNATCALPLVPAGIKDTVAAAVGIIIEAHGTEVSSCSGTLIGADLFLTARHCLTDPGGADMRSASVTFDYQPACNGSRPAGHVTRFFKVIGEAVSGSPPNGTNPPVSSDWVILRLDASPGSLPAPLQIRDTALMAGETIFTMHHPNGSVKKTQARTYAGGTSITGFDYAGGSSGSALFDINGRLVGGPLSSGSGCSVSYAPVAPIKAALTSPPPPPVPLDVMVVFDRSGSMASPAPPIGRTKLAEAQDAAALFVHLVREGAGDRLGLVTFSTSATTDRTPGPVATVKPLLVGPPPFNTGQIGGITAGGSTTIGGGVANALAAIGSGSLNQGAVLLLTDGLQNTAPMIESVEPTLGTTRLSVIGFGSDADIDAPLLSRLARDHGGQFTRAVDGLTLRKFFGLCFGNIFETGALTDPEEVLRAQDKMSASHKFSVCGEQTITLILGWDRAFTPLQAHIITPSGKAVNEKKIKVVRGQTWAYWRIPLPHQGEKDGVWQFTVDRVPAGGEFPPAPTDVRYFFIVICDGGPKLSYLGGSRRIYTGDPMDALVGLHYPNGTTPEAQVRVEIHAPTVALGQLVVGAGLRAPITSADTVDAFHATLQSIAVQAGGILPVGTKKLQFPLFDDGFHNDGAMEPDGTYNNVFKDLSRAEGTYEFRAIATFGGSCHSTREAFWSVHVEPSIDPAKSDVTVVDVTTVSGGNQGTVVIFPRDVYGNPFGPGRGGNFSVSPIPGVFTTGPIKDRGDGSYGVVITWDGRSTPGVVVQQPDRNPVVMLPSGSCLTPGGQRDCTKEAGQLLDCLGLDDPKVKCVRVKSITVEMELKDPGCCDKPCDGRHKGRDCGC